MEDRPYLLPILDRDVDYFQASARHYKVILMSLIATGITSFIAILALLNGGQISFTNGFDGWQVIPFYSATLLFSYGLYSFFMWYDKKMYFLQYGDTFKKSQKENVNENTGGKSEKSSIDPYIILTLLFYLIGFLSIIFSIIDIIRYGNNTSRIILAIVLFCLGIILILSSFRKNETAEKQTVLTVVFKHMNKDLYYYPSVLIYILLSFYIFFSIQTSDWINYLIIALYVVEIQIVLTQGILLYKKCVINQTLSNRLMALRFQYVHSKITYDETKREHEFIIKSTKF